MYICMHVLTQQQSVIAVYRLVAVLETIFKPDKRRLQAGAHQFLKIDPVWIVSMHVCLCACVCPRPRVLITSGVMWYDMNLIQLVKQVLQLLYDNCSCYC